MNNIDRRNLKYFILSGIIGTISANLFGPFTVKYLQRLGGTEFHISLLNSLPGVVGVFASLPGAIYMIRCNGKGNKRLTAEFALISRLIIMSFALLPFLPVWMAPLLCVILVGLRNIPESIAQTAFQGFTGDIFKTEIRSTAISNRNKYSVPVSLIITLAAGYALRVIPTNDQQRMVIYQIYFAVACVFGLAEVIAFSKMKETNENMNCSNLRIKDVILDVFRHKEFVGFTRSSLLFYFGWQMGWPLFNIYQVVNLKADEFWLSIIAVISSIGMFLGYSFWNRLIKTKGNAFVASITTLGMALNPVLLAISPNLYWVAALNLIIGFTTSGNVTVLLNYLLEVTPQENRVVYVGTYNTLINISLAVSPLIAHLVLQWSNIYIALFVVAIVRTLGSVVFYTGHRRDTRLNQVT